MINYNESKTENKKKDPIDTTKIDLDIDKEINTLNIIMSRCDDPYM